jgi:hypothetical protein
LIRVIVPSPRIAEARRHVAKSQDRKAAKDKLHANLRADPRSARFNVTTPGVARSRRER